MWSGWSDLGSSDSKPRAHIPLSGSGEWEEQQKGTEGINRTDRQQGDGFSLIASVPFHAVPFQLRAGAVAGQITCSGDVGERPGALTSELLPPSVLHCVWSRVTELARGLHGL